MLVVSSSLNVGEGFYWIGAAGPEDPGAPVPDATATGLVGLADGLVMVLTGTQFGTIACSVQPGDTDPGLDGAQWDEVIEFSLAVSPGSPGLGISAMDGGPDELAVLTAAGPGSYRLRLHVRGRDAGAGLDVVTGAPVEEHLLQVWPAAVSGTIIRKASDAFGRAIRDTAAEPGPDPRLPHGRSVILDMNQLVARTSRATMTLESVAVHAAGCELSFRIVVDMAGLTPHQEKQARRAVDGYARALTPDAIGPGRLSVALGLSDGRAAAFCDDTGTLPRGGPAVTDCATSSYPEGGAEVAEETFWAWPLPPAGPVTVFVEWPAVGIGPSSVTLDGAAIVAAASALPAP
jgi:hypothetical protein